MNDVRSDSEVVDRRQELDKISYEVHLNRLLKAGSSYDRAILSLDTASLGFTFAYIHVSSLSDHKCLLYFVWFFLISSIAFVLITLLIDQHRTVRRIMAISNSYIERKQESYAHNFAACLMEVLPILSGILFALALILFTVFVNLTI